MYCDSPWAVQRARSWQAPLPHTRRCLRQAFKRLFEQRARGLIECSPVNVNTRFYAYALYPSSAIHATPMITYAIAEWAISAEHSMLTKAEYSVPHEWGKNRLDDNAVSAGSFHSGFSLYTPFVCRQTLSIPPIDPEVKVASALWNVNTCENVRVLTWCDVCCIARSACEYSFCRSHSLARLMHSGITNMAMTAHVSMQIVYQDKRRDLLYSSRYDPANRW